MVFKSLRTMGLRWDAEFICKLVRGDYADYRV
jgi:hypothetical protein